MSELRRRGRKAGGGGGGGTGAQQGSGGGGGSGQAKSTTASSSSVLHAPWFPPLCLFVISLATRFWKIDTPDSVVFDEFHFGKFVNWYFKGEYLFDIHPPLGKLTFVLVGWLFGYDADKCQYDSIHQVYKEGCKFLVLRYTAALFGCLLPPLVYLIMIEFGASASGAVFAGALVVFDMLNLIESRLILTDSQLMFYSALALYIAILLWKRRNEVVTTARHRLRKQWTTVEENWWCLALGMACGAAVSIKWTALATPGLIAVESMFGIFFLHRELPFGMLLKIAAVVLVQYTLWFYIHFAMLPNTGSGDAFMPIEFQRTLVNNTNYDPSAPAVSFFYIYPELNREMLSANARIDVVHSWASRWTQWVYNARGVLYWSGNAPGGKRRIVYLMGNPIALWLCLGGVVLFLVTAMFYFRYRRTNSLIVKLFTAPMPSGLHNALAVCSYCIVCYGLNLFPYIAVSRSAFCYHYMPGLLYAEILLAMWVDRITRPYHHYVVNMCLLAVVLGFLYWSPWVYALPLTPNEHAARRWLPLWN